MRTSILFPVDLSGRCEAAVPQVKAMARLFDVPIYLLHVEEPDRHDPGNEQGMKALASRRVLTEMARRNFEGLIVRRAIKRGDVAGEISAFAKNHRVGMIMMPTRWQGRSRAALLDSVISKVLDDAPCQVWTSSHGEPWRPPPTEGIGSVLCAIDLSSESGSLIRAAAELGKQNGPRVRLVHAVADGENALERGMDPQLERQLKDAARTSVACLQREAGTNFDLCVEAGKPAQVIAAAARCHDADLVIVGRGRQNKFAGHLRTQAYAIIRDSPCPVLSV